MSDLAKFSRLAALRPARSGAVNHSTAAETLTAPDILAELLGARIKRNRYGEHLSLCEWYATPEICSPDRGSLSLLLPNLSGAEEGMELAGDPNQWLFLDTETTGLAGGTGTYAFMIGIAWWEAGGFQVEQFFMRDLNEEFSVLLELSERMSKRPVLVTFNGKSFDWPLLETRYRMARSLPACPPRLHLDLLHPARQLWRLRLGSVRLRDLERHVLGAKGSKLDWSRHTDIDSTLIPQMYFDYLRGGSPEPLAGIFRHNQMDLRGLAALAGKILTLLDSGRGAAAAAGLASHDPVALLGVSRILRKRGHRARAREVYETALSAGLPRPVERLAQQELAQLAKRGLDYARAVSLWDALRDAPTPDSQDELLLIADEGRKALESAIEAAEQLAIYYEHRAKEPQRALQLVRAAIAELHAARRSGKLSRGTEEKMKARLTRRLERLERRCAAKPLLNGGPDFAASSQASNL